MCLAGTGLSVCHYCPVEAVQDIVKNWASNLLEYFFLGTLHIEDVVVHEGDFLGTRVFDNQLRIFIDPMKLAGVRG